MLSAHTNIPNQSQEPHLKKKRKTKLTFDLFVVQLRLTVVTDDPSVLTVATVVCARCLFDAVC